MVDPLTPANYALLGDVDAGRVTFGPVPPVMVDQWAIDGDPAPPVADRILSALAGAELITVPDPPPGRRGAMRRAALTASGSAVYEGTDG